MAARRASTVPLAFLLTALTLTGCTSGGSDSTSASKDPRSGTRSGFDTSAVPTTAEQVGSPATSAPTPPTGPLPPEGVLTSSLTAYNAAMGGTAGLRVLRYTMWFPTDASPYAALQSQDPATPANVDERDWRNGRVGSPEPVKLAGTGDLEQNLFTFAELNWDAFFTVLADGDAPKAVEAKVGHPLDGSVGVTHMIVTKDLPFSANTVVRIYVDGGRRSQGGYVQYLASGTLDKVQA
ncbi:MAG: hypothetical protein U0Q22_12635 [Acidimicrobiales bacterium]